MNYHIIFDSSYEAFGFSLNALFSIIDADGGECGVGEWSSKWDMLSRLRFLENRICNSRILLEIEGFFSAVVSSRCSVRRPYSYGNTQK